MRCKNIVNRQFIFAPTLMDGSQELLLDVEGEDAIEVTTTGSRPTPLEGEGLQSEVLVPQAVSPLRNVVRPVSALAHETTVIEEPNIKRARTIGTGGDGGDGEGIGVGGVQSIVGTSQETSFREPLDPWHWIEPPVEEKLIDAEGGEESIGEDERRALPEYFVGHHVKTPERYLRIRNAMVAGWRKQAPKYLGRTAARKLCTDCGDVNAIGRVHGFLDLWGAINFGSVGAPARRPVVSGVLPGSRASASLQGLTALVGGGGGGGDRSSGVGSAKRISDAELVKTLSESQTVMAQGPRRRRPPSTVGLVSERVVTTGPGGVMRVASMGHTGGVPVLAAQAEQEQMEAREAARLDALNSGYFDDGSEEPGIEEPGWRRGEEGDSESEFRLVKPTRVNGALEPFRVVVYSSSLLMMDLHAHLATSEIIGLLAGTWDREQRILTIVKTVPCESLNTGAKTECEMDPVSEMAARDIVAAAQLSVVGWYHSHPTFAPTPSVRDLENQAAYQGLFRDASSGFAPFVGFIVSPWDRRNPGSSSRWMVFSVPEGEAGELLRPLSLRKTVHPESPLVGTTMEDARVLVARYMVHPDKVIMNRQWRPESGKSKAEKVIAALKAHVYEGDDVWAEVERGLRAVIDSKGASQSLVAVPRTIAEGFGGVGSSGVSVGSGGFGGGGGSVKEEPVGVKGEEDDLELEID